MVPVARGVNIDITPRVHDEGEVSLDLKVEISSLAATTTVAGVQSLPTFNSRTVSSHLRMVEGETTVLAGLISDTERRNMTGIPGLSDLPLIGHLFTSHHTEGDQTDIVMTLRPHVVMRPEITPDDLRAFTLASEAPPLLFEVPASSTGPSAQPPPPPPGGVSPMGLPRAAEPIRAPQPSPTPAPQR
jgi:general secretion pathway protein D